MAIHQWRHLPPNFVLVPAFRITWEINYHASWKELIPSMKIHGITSQSLTKKGTHFKSMRQPQPPTETLPYLACWAHQTRKQPCTIVPTHGSHLKARECLVVGCLHSICWSEATWSQSNQWKGFKIHLQLFTHLWTWHLFTHWKFLPWSGAPAA